MYVCIYVYIKEYICMDVSMCVCICVCMHAYEGMDAFIYVLYMCV